MSVPFKLLLTELTKVFIFLPLSIVATYFYFKFMVSFTWEESYYGAIYLGLWLVPLSIIQIVLCTSIFIKEGDFNSLDIRDTSWKGIVISPFLFILLIVGLIMDAKNPYHKNNKLPTYGCITEYLISNYEEMDDLIADFLVKYKQESSLLDSSYSGYISHSKVAFNIYYKWSIFGRIKSTHNYYFTKPTKEEKDYYSVLLGIDTKCIV